MELESNIKEWGCEDHVKVHRNVVGRQDGLKEGGLYVHEHRDYSTMLATHPERDVKYERRDTVYMKTLDDLLADEESVDLIKIDTEGYELEILHGAMDTIAKHNPMFVIECHTPFNLCMIDRVMEESHVIYSGSAYCLGHMYACKTGKG